MTGCRQSLYFTAPRTVAARDEAMPRLGAGEVLVETVVSAISSGTELLVYRDQMPTDMPVDASIPGFGDFFEFPLKYGYAAVGRITAAGHDASRDWLGRMVVAFHPHESHFAASPEDLLPVPAGIGPETAAFLPSMETAVTLLMDGHPMIGERVVVLGQGMVGLLTTALLTRHPLDSVVTLDPHPLRRGLSVELGAHQVVDPGAVAEVEPLKGSFDLAYELSGNPAVLDDAVSLTGFAGRVVIGSWYGEKTASLHLGGSFHRSRIQLIASQVSTIAPQSTGRWSKARRLEVAWRMLAEADPTSLITHRFPLSRAAEAYDLLDRRPQEAGQVLLTYGDPCTSG